MLIADHSSTDKTPEILRQLQAEGLPLRVRRVYAAGYVQVETMNALLREAAVDECADIVLPLDADEFLIADEGAASCREIVQGL
ncbi:MAG: glycosyltransferase family 2 protein, partial [Selenomonas massiliensis]